MNFYVLIDPRDISGPAVTNFGKADPVNRGEAHRCSVCGSYISALPWLPPYKAELEVWGKEYGDIAFMPGGNELLVSARFADLYKAEGLTGLSGFHEVEIMKVIRRGGSHLNAPPPRYYCVSIIRSRAAIDLTASEVIHAKPVTCNECRAGSIKRWSRIVIEENTWSGEDVFEARGLVEIITSERFKEFFVRNRVNNGVLVNAAEYAHDFYPWEKNARTGQ